MSITTYLETAPLSEIIPLSGAQTGDAVPFAGSPRKHPFSKDKLIFLNDPLGENASIIEFKLADVVRVEELPSPVTESGEGIRLVKLWVRRGSFGMRLDPFEVQNPPRFMHNSDELHDLILKHFG